MAAASHITDPFLQSVLASAEAARAQCTSMLDFLDQHRSSSPPTHDAELELSKHQKALQVSLAKLRGLNRKAITDVRATKQQTQEAKSEIDSLHLQLQNLYYEQRHLRGEIAGCEGYDHTYTTLPLVPVDEFLSSNPDLSSASEHDLMIARIKHEHAERQVLEEQRQALLKRKQALIAENNKKKEELAGLDREIEKWINGSGAVQKVFERKEEREEKEREKQGGKEEKEREKGQA